MSQSADQRFHEEWLGMVQPLDGLVVSIPVLVDAQFASRQPVERQRQLEELTMDAGAERAFRDLGSLTELLDWPADAIVPDAELPDDFRLYVPEGKQLLRATLGLRTRPDAPPTLLVWDLGEDAAGTSLDKPTSFSGPWDYPASGKLDRLLRHARVPIGVLTNRTHVRLIYAPHGESTGSITFRVADMLSVGGRPIFDAFVMLLGAQRLFSVAEEHQLPKLLQESRTRQANVTNALSGQVLEALGILLHGFEQAAERDGRPLLDAARSGDHVYGALLTQLLRLVFVLYAEDQGLLPIDNELYAKHMSVLGLFDELEEDHDAHPDTMSRRFGAYGRLVALFRAIYLGVEHDTLRMPARRGTLFSPHEYPFLEGWEGDPGSAPIVDASARAATRLPSVDDETVYQVLERLLILNRQRLSYRALDVEQIGSVYEALMGYHVERLAADAVCLRPARVWITADAVLDEAPATRTRWLQDQAGMAKGQADKITKALAGTKKADAALEILDGFAIASEGRREAGRLVLQPGPERRRTSSHYTPRSLTAPIVRKTLEPLFRAMGEDPPSERILSLKICDPAMGSGAFLVEACRYLADQVVIAWTREGKTELLHGVEDATLHARRLVAQRCLYGVDKNAYAVNLAKLSLWLVTLARDLPFTFVDHALRHGDSLVGLSLEQIVGFHWKPAKQLELTGAELSQVLNEAIRARNRILDLAGDSSPAAQREKEALLRDAEDAIDRVRLIGDVCVGAFFAGEKDKDREKERERRLALVLEWLRSNERPTVELEAMRAEMRARTPVFHWMAEYPEVFWQQRPDPLDTDKVGAKAWIDAFIGNPPFRGGASISTEWGAPHLAWLLDQNEGSHGNADYCVYFIRRAYDLLGEHGTLTLIATNTVSQGDTRRSGLRYLTERGGLIVDCIPSLPWPGDAAVTVATVTMAKGRIDVTNRKISGREVLQISSRLRETQDTDPIRLQKNSALFSQGVDIRGQHFVLEGDQEAELLAKEPSARSLIRGYLGGDEVNSDPLQRPHRSVIAFTGMSLDEARRWPITLGRVEDLVRPERESLPDSPINRRLKQYWWRFWAERPDFIASLGSKTRCIVTAAVGKHLVFSFQPTDRVLSKNLFLFCMDGHSEFASLQSRIHEGWTRLLSSTMEDRLRYAASDCFETFPFPQSDPRTVLPDLESLGQRLYDTRAAYMVSANQGLTQTYNRLKDADCDEPDILALRALHLDLDRAVLTAYGWQDLIPLVPAYTTPRTDAEKRAFAAFEDAVIDRLFALNAERAEAERLAGSASAPPAKAKAKRPRKRKATPNQPALLPDEEPT